MKYYAIMYGEEASGCCTDDGLIDVLLEDHGESKVLAIISKKDFDRFGDFNIPADRLKNRVIAEIVKSVKLSPLF